MNTSDKGIGVFFSLIILYIATGYLGSILGQTVGFAAKILLLSAFVWYYRSWFVFKPKFDILAIGLGIIVALIWVALDPLYPHLAPVDELATFSTLDIILKLIIGVCFASLIEEFFTRFFLHRAVEAKDWLKIPIGRYSLTPFIVTTIFFAISHSRWLAGLITGVILNLIWYKRKEMNSVVLVHAVANLVLGIIVIVTGNYSFWS